MGVVICLCGGIKRFVVRGNCVKSLTLCFYSPLRSIITVPFPNSIFPKFCAPAKLEADGNCVKSFKLCFTVCQQSFTAGNLLQYAERVYRLSELKHRKMQMRACAHTGIADFADFSAGVDDAAARYKSCAQMTVQGFVA